jgi:hypothetical protein
MLAASNLRQVAIAMHNYHNDYRHLPQPAIYDKNGRPLLSWRVMLLPYLEEEGLYKQFHLDEPWDSPHNLTLLCKMPKVFKPVGDVEVERYHTFSQVVVGTGAPFEHGRDITLGMITVADGVTDTWLVVEAGEAVPWTKPADLVYDPDGPLPTFGGLFAPRFRLYNDDFRSPGGFNAAYGDGSTRWIRPISKHDEKAVRRLITWNDGEKDDVSAIVD